MQARVLMGAAAFLFACDDAGPGQASGAPEAGAGADDLAGCASLPSPPERAFGDRHFGSHVATAGDVLVVGAAGGLADIFERSDGSWRLAYRTQLGKDAEVLAVAASAGNAVIVWGPSFGRTEDSLDLYQRDVAGWSRVARRSIPGTGGWAYRPVAVSDRFVATLADRGRHAVVFERTSDGWMKTAQVAYTAPADAVVHDLLAPDLSVDGSELAVVSRSPDGASMLRFLARSGAEWAQRATIELGRVNVGRVRIRGSVLALGTWEDGSRIRIYERSAGHLHPVGQFYGDTLLDLSQDGARVLVWSGALGFHVRGLETLAGSPTPRPRAAIFPSWRLPWVLNVDGAFLAEGDSVAVAIRDAPTEDRAVGAGQVWVIDTRRCIEPAPDPVCGCGLPERAVCLEPTATQWPVEGRRCPPPYDWAAFDLLCGLESEGCAPCGPGPCYQSCRENADCADPCRPFCSLVDLHLEREGTTPAPNLVCTAGEQVSPCGL